MAALMCNAAARIGFLLAALHSVAERVNPRKARPPAPHCPRVLASAARPRLPLLGEERTTPGLSKNQNTGSCDLFHLGDTARWLGNGERSCGSWRRRRAVRSFGQTGTDRVGWYACPRLDSLCDRMERGEEKSNARRRVAFQRPYFADVKARRILTSDRRKFPSGNFRSARDLEVAKRVRRGQAYRLTSTVPVCPKDRTARLRHRNLSGLSPCLPGIEECPHLLAICKQGRPIEALQVRPASREGWNRASVSFHPR